MDYEVEHGATPNFKALKLAEQQAVQEEKDKQEEEKLNPMKLLENRTKASRREMESIEALEDLKEINQRQISLDYESILQKKLVEEQEMLRRQEEEDELFVQSIFHKNANNKTLPDESSDSDEELPKFGITFSASDKSTNSLLNDNSIDDNKSKPSSKRKLLEKIVVVKQKKTDSNGTLKSNDDKPSSSNSSSNNNNNNSKPLLSNLCAYSDSENSE